MVREAGFENITVDLMFGIPNQSIEDLQRDLNILKELKPENVSIYSLIWEEGTVFWSKLQKGILSEIDQDVEAQMYEMIIEFFNENGYCHYEISNFARIDKKFENIEKINIENEYLKNYKLEKEEVKKLKIESFEKIEESQKNSGRHNLKYWKNQEFIGVGMSAASFYEKNRHSNVRTFKKYYNLIDNHNLPTDENSIEIVDEIEREKLKNMLGLRLIQEGIEYFEDEKVEKLIKNGLLEKFAMKKIEKEECEIEKNQKNKKILNLKEKKIKINSENNVFFTGKIWGNAYEMRLRLTKNGMLLANDVFVEFI